MKTCTKCGETKAVGEFHKSKREKDGLMGWCKLCRKEYAAKRYTDNKELFAERAKQARKKNPELFKKRSDEYYAANKERISERDKAYRLENSDKLKERSRRYYEKNKEKHRAYAVENKEKIAERMRNYRQDNIEQFAERAREYAPTRRELRNLRYDNDPEYRLLCRIRARVNSALRGRTKSASTIELLGAPPDFVRQYIEVQFSEGMTWDSIDVDHIRPCASFDLTDPEEQRRCFHYSNLQPLFTSDNRSKNDKWDGEMHVPLDFKELMR